MHGSDHDRNGDDACVANHPMRPIKKEYIMKIKIPYTRFKADHDGKYYDEDYFEYDLSYQGFEYMDEKQKGRLYYKMHTEILPELCKNIGKDFYIVVLDDCYIGWPYLWIPENVTYND